MGLGFRGSIFNNGESNGKENGNYYLGVGGEFGSRGLGFKGLGLRGLGVQGFRGLGFRD